MMTPKPLLLALCFFSALQYTSAIDCPPGSVGTPEGRCEQCPPGTYKSGTICDPCPPGTFNPSPGAASMDQCKDCPAGTFSFSDIIDIGSASCTPCPPGTFSVKGSLLCQKCPEGTFARKSGTASCTTCPRRRSSRVGYKRCLKRCPLGSALSPRKTACRKCPPGTFRPRRASITKCLICPPGKTSGKGAKKCRKCPKGTSRRIFRTEERDLFGLPILKPKCAKCGTNTFADVKGLEACKLCPLGTVSKPGAKKCTSCPAGTFRSQIRGGSCISCPEGTTSLGKKPAGCKHPRRGCPLNTFEDRNGECRACMPGERLDIHKKRCVPCGKRQISLGGVTTVCKTCPRGKRPADSNSIFEKSRCECIPGTETDGFGRCTTCRPGTRWRRDESNVREQSFKQGSCEACPVRTFSDKPGVTDCKPCPFGTLSGRDSTTCMQCPAGTTTEAGDPTRFDEDSQSSICFQERNGCRPYEVFEVFEQGCELSDCPPGLLPSVDGLLCGDCEPNKFLNELECLECPAGQASPGGLVTECTVCPKNAEPTFDGICRCVGRFGDDGKGGCKRCPRGQISIAGNCGTCGEDTIPIINGLDTRCEICEGDTFKPPGARRCKKCPKGFVRERDVFGLPVNRCVPAYLFPVSTGH